MDNVLAPGTQAWLEILIFIFCHSLESKNEKGRFELTNLSCLQASDSMGATR